MNSANLLSSSEQLNQIVEKIYATLYNNQQTKKQTEYPEKEEFKF